MRMREKELEEGGVRGGRRNRKEPVRFCLMYPSQIGKGQEIQEDSTVLV